MDLLGPELEFIDMSWAEGWEDNMDHPARLNVRNVTETHPIFKDAESLFQWNALDSPATSKPQVIEFASATLKEEYEDPAKADTETHPPHVEIADVEEGTRLKYPSTAYIPTSHNVGRLITRMGTIQAWDHNMDFLLMMQPVMVAFQKEFEEDPLERMDGAWVRNPDIV
ncbi:hypothetical protein QFC19_008954 [Naganishia cerealis]|uniref:Uncharacterized protein n=1 Tax=Naganishia cerealis TaxID=610337 RepID=A0ACC2UXS0_9TREE|nr:hypothetical protein QFC19_008954 [Naganishia cerealis]